MAGSSGPPETARAVSDGPDKPCHDGNQRFRASAILITRTGANLPRFNNSDYYKAPHARSFEISSPENPQSARPVSLCAPIRGSSS